MVSVCIDTDQSSISVNLTILNFDIADPYDASLECSLYPDSSQSSIRRYAIDASNPNHNFSQILFDLLFTKVARIGAAV